MNKRFKDLRQGSKFVFDSEVDPRFRFSGMARGPWIKLSARTYRHETTDAPESIRVGSINAKIHEVSD